MNQSYNKSRQSESRSIDDIRNIFSNPESLMLNFRLMKHSRQFFMKALKATERLTYQNFQFDQY